MRINIYGEIAGLRVREGNWTQAQGAIKRGLDSATVIMMPELEARLLVGLAIILIQQERYAQAHAATIDAAHIYAANAQAAFDTEKRTQKDDLLELLKGTE